MQNKIVEKIRNMERQTQIFIVVIFLCVIGVGAFLSAYFGAYQKPYLEKTVIDLSPSGSTKWVIAQLRYRSLQTLVPARR